MDKFNFERLLSSKLKRRSLLIGAGALTGIAIAQAGTVTGFASQHSTKVELPDQYYQDTHLVWV